MHLLDNGSERLTGNANKEGDTTKVMGWIKTGTLYGWHLNS